MRPNTTEAPAVSPATLAVPLTLEGASVLHQMFRFRWGAWRQLSAERRSAILDAASAAFAGMKNTGLFSQIGHKGDLLIIHFRDSFDELNAAELAIQRLELADYLEATTSYVSVIELGLYQSTVQLQEQLAARGVTPESEEWVRAVEETMARQREAMRPRLWPEIPPRRYLCFYPMDKRRGESKNWYEVPIKERQRMMHEHGLIGRKYADSVKQIISGSIGFDDWEWGVDLFAEDPVVFKKLIYEMRFDEASAVYALFGPFYVGLRVQADELGAIFAL